MNGIASGFLTSLTEPLRAVKTKVDVRFAIEDLHFLTDSTLYLLEEIPLSYIGLTWNYDNPLAGGALGEDGLKPLGKNVVRLAETLGIVTDTAHLNRRSFYDVIETAKGRVMNSHCCFDAVRNHPRNLTDDQIALLQERGGIVGLTLERSFLDERNADLNAVVRHIDHFVQKFGCDTLCIGSDFNGSSPPKGLMGYDGFSALKSRLLARGYKNRDVDKIFFKNAMNFFSDKP